MLPELRARGGAADVPAIALTGRATAADRTAALAKGFQVFIAKPADPAAVIAAIDSLCRPLR
jgi:CheY-like chemotaxis protein